MPRKRDGVVPIGELDVCVASLVLDGKPVLLP